MEIAKIIKYGITALVLAACQLSWAAEGEIGTGIPDFGVYSEIVGAHVTVWALNDATVGMPSGDNHLILTQQLWVGSPIRFLQVSKFI